MRRLLLLLLIATSAVAEEPLTNTDVLRLLKDGVPASVVTAKIKTSTTRFDLTTDAIVTLTKAGVPEAVLTAMLESTKTAPAAAPPAKPVGPDMLTWKQECEKTGWPDYICHPGTSELTFHKVAFYEPRAHGASAQLTLTRHRLSATIFGKTVFDIPWSDVESFCTEFAWRNMFYLRTKERTITFDLGGGEDELSGFLRNILRSIKTEKCEQ
jgi:hypothetical protein